MREEAENWWRQAKHDLDTAEILEFWPDVVDLEVLCYTRDEFAKLKDRLGIVKRAVAEGIEI